MITNLLNTPVKFATATENEVTGNIRGIVDRNGQYVFLILAHDGKFYERRAEGVTALNTIEHGESYTVVMFWREHEKIKAIKAVRSITKMDLKAAKDFVEAQPRVIKVKEHISLEEAHGIRYALVNDNQMECEIRKEF